MPFLPEETLFIFALLVLALIVFEKGNPCSKRRALTWKVDQTAKRMLNLCSSRPHGESQSEQESHSEGFVCDLARSC